MKPLDGPFGLIRPDAAKSSLATNQDRTGIRIDEELWKLGLGKPGAIVFDHLDHIGGFTLDRNHARPCQRRPAAFACAGKRLAVNGHLFFTELAHDRAWQHAFNEDVLFQNHLLAAAGPETLEYTSRIFRPVGPGERGDDRFHINDALHAIAIAVGP